MRSQIRKRVHSAFELEFKKRYPQFLSWDAQSSSFFVWKWQVTPRLVFFTTLQCLDDDDVFLLEIAFSEDGEFPWTSFGPLPKSDTTKWRSRLGTLWKPTGIDPHWDLAPEIGEARRARRKATDEGLPLEFPPDPSVDVVTTRIMPKIADALCKFGEYAVPVFNKISHDRGLENVM